MLKVAAEALKIIRQTQATVNGYKVDGDAPENLAAFNEAFSTTVDAWIFTANEEFGIGI